MMLLIAHSSWDESYTNNLQIFTRVLLEIATSRFLVPERVPLCPEGFSFAVIWRTTRFEKLEFSTG